jgi:hypothetical protein
MEITTSITWIVMVLIATLWQMASVLNEQTKTNGYAGKYDMIMNLAQAMLAGRSLEAFLTERR